MATEAPPPYEETAPPPAYPELQEPIVNKNESIDAAPPPAAFGQTPPNIQYPVVQQKNSGGEVYKPIASQSNAQANDGGGGENAAQNIVRVVYIQPQNPYPAQIAQAGYPAHGVAANNYNRYGQPPSDAPRDLFHFTIRDHRINAFGANEQCVCCCHLEMAAYICLVVFIIYHCFSIEKCLVVHEWGWYGYHEYDVILAIYSGFNIIINVICFLGVIQCKSQYIRPQIWILLSFILVLICNLVLRIILNEITFLDVVGLIIMVAVTLWFSWLFHRVYKWAYYYQHGGQYVANVFKPPQNKQMQPQQIQAAVQPQQIQMQQIRVIPQDGNL